MRGNQDRFRSEIASLASTFGIRVHSANQAFLGERGAGILVLEPLRPLARLGVRITRIISRMVFFPICECIRANPPSPTPPPHSVM